ncbi:hypothetical protein [Dyadobacter pollutisoli]|jgi:hypothetical protein|uniref:Uncharacterized protein n=1 Tax=Dyadobacter pollutisoli TaxID=2910158 RepID=A0A9E8NBM6_9BACT|nr:hypothetical protein [Dyadobacter pollutisoli]WAC11412.1 hypothetical protein ON006_27225 [Dyadobacter pollutisoli]
MKTLQITILTETDSEKVMHVLQELQDQKLIEIHEVKTATAPPSYEQIEEIIDESEIGPYYSAEEARAILKL